MTKAFYKKRVISVIFKCQCARMKSAHAICDAFSPNPLSLSRLEVCFGGAHSSSSVNLDHLRQDAELNSLENTGKISCVHHVSAETRWFL